MINWLKAYFLGMFFLPNAIREQDPAFFNINHEEVRFMSPDNRSLHGYFFKPKGKAKGTLVHCHGNFGNITHHFSLILFLVNEGYNVFGFDYGGYGHSAGKPSPEGIVTDTLSALTYVRTRPDVDPAHLALFGQSLGGAAAAGAMAEDPAVRCLILEGTFTTYREMAKATAIGRMLFFLTPFVIPHVGPKINLPKIAPRPILILHGETDDLIPARFGSELYKHASEKKTLVLLKDFGHLQGDDGMPAYRQAIFRFLKEHLD